MEQLEYDRILADVPCSGDGTARKNPNVAFEFTPSAGNSLHHLQVSASIVFDSTDSLWMKAVDRPWSALAAVFISAGMPVN